MMEDKITYEITETKIDNNLISKLLNKLKLVPNDYLKACLGKNVMIANSQLGEILSVAFVSNINEMDFEQYKNCLPLLEFIDIKTNILPDIVNGGIWLGVLESLKKGEAYGTEIVNELKKKYNSIILFADEGADYYWIKQNFQNIGTGMFLWVNN